MGRNLDHGRVLADATSRGGPGVDERCYGDDPESCRVYGGLYTSDEALQGGGRRGPGACPTRWHVPSRREWKDRARPLGPATAGEQLKARKDHDPPYDGTDDAGFTALPGDAAFRGSFGRKGDWAVFWTSSEVNAERAVSVGLERYWSPEPPRYRSLVVDSFYLKENARGPAVPRRCPGLRRGAGRPPRETGVILTPRSARRRRWRDEGSVPRGRGARGGESLHALALSPDRRRAREAAEARVSGPRVR